MESEGRTVEVTAQRERLLPLHLLPVVSAAQLPKIFLRYVGTLPVQCKTMREPDI